MSITLETVGTRLYFVGDTFAQKNKIKEIGGHWDGDRRQWWIGKTKLAAAEALVSGSATAAQEPKKVGDDSKVVAKAKYKGRTYYVLWVGQCKSGDYKARLTVLDGSIDFWAACARPHERNITGDGEVAAIIKTYEPREYRGRTEYSTLGSIRRFIERQKEGERTGNICAECGKDGELVQDLEDGMMKHRHCCDIEP